jgi:phage terminase small subunit
MISCEKCNACSLPGQLSLRAIFFGGDGMKLTPKQKAFADYYIESLQSVESYRKAGYQVKKNETARANASRLLANASVRAYIDEQMLQKDNDRIASADEVLAFLTSVQRGEVTEQVPLVLGKEFKVIDKEPSIKDRTRAAELLGKRYSLYTDRIEASTTNEIIVTWGDEDGAED